MWSGLRLAPSKDSNRPILVPELDLAHMNLWGVIPSAFGETLQVFGLRQLFLTDNHCSGPLPLGLSCLVKLTHLSLSHNHFSGPVPQALFHRMRDLRLLSLASNPLTGPLPELHGLSSIEVLDLSRCRFVGPVPDGLVTLKSLHGVSLHINDLRGRIPHFELSRLPHLRYIRLHGNPRLQGPVPVSWRCHLRELSMDSHIQEISFRSEDLVSTPSSKSAADVVVTEDAKEASENGDQDVSGGGPYPDPGNRSNGAAQGEGSLNTWWSLGTTATTILETLRALHWGAPAMSGATAPHS